MYFDPAVGQFRQLAEETGVALGHYVAVLVPEIEHIAEHIDGRSLRLDTVEKPYKPAFLHPGVGDGQRAQVGI